MAFIKLRTGLPGNGKTLLTISDVIELQKELVKAGSESSVHYNGIELTEVGRGTLQNWHSVSDDDLKTGWWKLPPGCIIVIDEAWRIFPVRTKDKVPEYIGELRLHRHHGQNFFLMSQSPRDLDVAVRRLVSEHTHIVRSGGLESSKLFTWSACNDAVDDPKTRFTATQKLVTYPREVYPYYKSAEVHQVKKRLPPHFLKLMIAVLICFTAGWYAFSSLWSKSSLAGDSEVSVFSSSSGGSRSGDTSGSGSLAEILAAFELSKITYSMRSRPRISNVPWSAEFYDGVLEPVDFPRPNCVRSPARCTCYTQQASMLDIDQASCLTYVKRGFFNPTKEPLRRDEADKIAYERMQDLICRAYPSRCKRGGYDTALQDERRLSALDATK